MPSSSILANTAPEHEVVSPSLLATCREMLERQTPNFFRLYLNPYVVQTCLCLSKYVQRIWPRYWSDPGLQSFLANSFDEALSGAIKLARFTGYLSGRPAAGLVIDRADRLGPFASLSMPDGGTLDFVPELSVVDDDPEQVEALAGKKFGFVVLSGSPTASQEVLRRLLREQAPLIITCLDRAGLISSRQGGLLGEWTPDIVLFDESFVDHQVPFAAFTAAHALFDHWNRPGRTTFHSTTFQPNTISTLHFMKCLARHEPDFHAQIMSDLQRIADDPRCCASLLSRLYSPTIARAIATLGLDHGNVRASGHYLIAGERKIFDGVAGIACSVRGHNPPDYAESLEPLDTDCRRAVADRLEQLTGLEHHVPAVSGATAVENALRLGLAATYPRQYVLAFDGGFGGKTLLSLVGTAKTTYKDHIDPLYDKVVYVDPHSPDIIADLESAFEIFPIGVVQLELIQAVGGIRPIPEHVVRWLDDNKRRLGYLLFVDEVQTGMYRTGAFTRSEQLGITPDLLTLGKGTSDMMCPFALTLYTRTIQSRLEELQPDLAKAMVARCDYDLGYRTVLATLRRAQESDLGARVVRSTQLFARLLRENLRDCKNVREVRVHGLLIAIEIDESRWPHRWFTARLPLLYALAMMRHKNFPLIMGFCQYEPHVLKFTPPLSITNEEIHQACVAISEVMKRPFYRLLPSALGALGRSLLRHRRKGYKI